MFYFIEDSLAAGVSKTNHFVVIGTFETPLFIPLCYASS